MNIIAFETKKINTAIKRLATNNIADVAIMLQKSPTIR